MDQNLLQKIDDLERVHQIIKYGWFEWAKKHPENVTNRGIGSNNNKRTVEFLKNEGSIITSEFSQILQWIIKKIRTIQDPRERYQIYREIYYIHPSFHERCLFFDDHLKLNTNNIVNGRRGFKQFLDNPNRELKDIKGIATYSLRRLILIENLLSNYLDISLFDAEPIPDETLPQIAGKYNDFFRFSLNEKITAMPEIFSITLTLLEKSNYSSLEPEILLSQPGWFHWAACAINEGPIFKKTTPKTRIEIFSSIQVSAQDDFLNELLKHYEIQSVFSDGIKIFEGYIPEKNEVGREKWEQQIPPKNSQYSEDFHSNFAQQNGVGEIFEYLINICKTRFPQYSIMGNSINFQVQNVLGFSKLDAFNLLPRRSNLKRGLKFQLYPIALCKYFDIPVSQLVDALPQGSKEWYWQGKISEDAFGYQGYFHSLEEAKKIIQAIIDHKVHNHLKCAR